MDHGGRHPVPGSLVVLDPAGGPTWGPREGRVLFFGRDGPRVHVCVGPDDQGVSRRHGALEFTAGRWWVRVLGTRPVHVGGTQVLRKGEDPLPLGEGRTSLLVEGENPRNLHLLRVHVVEVDEHPPRVVRSGTLPVRSFALEPHERLCMAVVAQRHLLHCTDPQPLTAREAATELADLQPDVGWTQKKVEHLVKRLRERLAGQGVDGLVPEPGQPAFDSAYRRNLIDVLVGSGTLGADDLRLLGLHR